MVTARRIQLIERSLAALRGVLVVGIGLAAWQAVRPRQTPAPSEQVAEPVIAAAAPSPVEPRPLAWYEPLWQRDLNQSPVPEAPQRRDVAPPEPLPALVATLVEPTRSAAHLRTRSGQMVRVSTGEQVSGYEVEAIVPGRVRLTRAGAEYWVDVPKPEGRR